MTKNIYNLLSGDLKDLLDATNSIRHALEEATKKIAKIKHKYPDSEIGDIDTDEEIISDFYNMIHHHDIEDSTDQQDPKETSE